MEISSLYYGNQKIWRTLEAAPSKIICLYHKKEYHVVPDGFIYRITYNNYKGFSITQFFKKYITVNDARCGSYSLWCSLHFNNRKQPRENFIRHINPHNMFNRSYLYDLIRNGA